MSLLEQLDLSARNQSALSEHMFGVLRSFVYEHTGIYFQDNKRYLLESRVGRRLQSLGLPDFNAYFDFLSNGGFHREMPQLVNAITINETYFFRNIPQLEALETEILPELARQRDRFVSRPLRIWSAACSTGDEAYTMAMMIREKVQPRWPELRFELIGTDINSEVIEKARAGVYGTYAVRNVPPEYMKYFSVEAERFTLRSDIRNAVSFKILNLMNRAGMSTMRGFDVIVCANVLIYFDGPSKQQVVESLYNSLAPGGYLLVGFSETLYGVTQAFQPVRFDKTIAYRKE
jgi:chemotaxis protein methyltransferase CheR